MNTSTCNSNCNFTTFKVVKKEGRCNYHKARECQDNTTLGPKGLCLEVYHNAYPHCLGMLYGATSEDECTASHLIRCPSHENYVVMEIVRSPLFLRFKLLNIIKKIVNKFFPIAIPRCRILLKVRKVIGDCPKKHKTGDAFEFNLGNLQLTSNIIIPLGYPSEMCPAAFDNLYPFIGWHSLNKRLPWINDDNHSILQCPDHKSNISFRFEKIEQCENKLQQAPNNSCVDYDGLTVKVLGGKGECRYGYAINREYSCGELIPPGFCLAMFHTAIPYYLTLINGGRFGWLRNRNAIIFQCPNPNVAVVANLSAIDNISHKLSFEVTETKSKCPQQMLLGKKFNLQKDRLPFCPKALDALFPYINILNATRLNTTHEKSKSISATVACPGYPSYRIFELSFIGREKKV